MFDVASTVQGGKEREGWTEGAAVAHIDKAVFMLFAGIKVAERTSDYMP